MRTLSLSVGKQYLERLGVEAWRAKLQEAGEKASALGYELLTTIEPAGEHCEIIHADQGGGAHQGRPLQTVADHARQVRLVLAD